MDGYPLMRKNFRHLYADVFWYGVLAGSALAFLPIYAARLGANGLEIGLLTAGPAVVNLLISLPAGKWLEGRSLVSASAVSAALSRVGFLLYALLPLFLEARTEIWALVLVTLAISLPGAPLAISFNALFAEIVPPNRRAEVVGRRNAILAVSLTLSTLMCGFLLDQIVFPINYQIVFGLGALGALVSTYHLARLQPVRPELEAAIHPQMRRQILAWLQVRQTIRRLERLAQTSAAALVSFSHLSLLRGPLGLFMLSYFLFYTFQYLCIPIFPLAYVQTLQFSDGMISLGSGLFYAAMFFSSLGLKRLAARFGHRWLLILSALTFASYPLVIGLADGPVLYWIGSLLGGLVYGLISASLINRLMEVVPERERAAGMAFHNLALNLGILSGSLAGPWVVHLVGVQEGLLLGAALRVLVGLLMILWA